MIRVLQHHETEMSDPVRIALKKKHGIDCITVRAARPIDNGVGETSLHAAVYRYIRPSNGQTLWLIEAELFTPPDAQWWRSWVVDGEPSDEQMMTIVANNLQTGSAL